MTTPPPIIIRPDAMLGVRADPVPEHWGTHRLTLYLIDTEEDTEADIYDQIVNATERPLGEIAEEFASQYRRRLVEAVRFPEMEWRLEG